QKSPQVVVRLRFACDSRLGRFAGAGFCSVSPTNRRGGERMLKRLIARLFTAAVLITPVVAVLAAGAAPPGVSSTGTRVGGRNAWTAVDREGLDRKSVV